MIHIKGTRRPYHDPAPFKKEEFAAFASQDSQWSRSFRIVYHKVHSKEPNTSPYIPALKGIVSSYDLKSPLEDIQGYFIDKK